MAHATQTGSSKKLVTIFLCGDVMPGRGIDQVLPHPVDPILYESYVQDARRYVKIAEQVNGPIAKPVDFSYIWGDALAELDRVSPDVRLINLETSITISPDYWPGKGINYRMHPKNAPVLTAAKIDACTLANNHVLDWGYEGLAETLTTLQKLGVKVAGAGKNLEEAEAPAILPMPGKGRLVVFSFGTGSSGVPSSWSAGPDKPGVNFLADLSDNAVYHIKDLVGTVKQEGDTVIASIHWGGNWGYSVPAEQRRFAQQLIETAGVDLVYGHSSHHVKGIEVYKGKLILYGCGDFLNDYEGISGYEEFRGDLALMYFAGIDPFSGDLVSLHMVPTATRKFQVHRASHQDALWLRDILNREGKRFNARAEIAPDNILILKWE